MRGIQFVNAIGGGVIPREYIPAVERGVREALDNGPLGGYPLVDLKISLVDGSFHTVDSSEMAFRSAGMMAIREGVSKAGPVLLEPIADIEVVTPGDYLSEVIGDLGTRRAPNPKYRGSGRRTDSAGAGAVGRDVRLHDGIALHNSRAGLLHNGVPLL